MRRPSPTSAKRWTLKIALCHLAGAVVTWGVAWGCALWAPAPYPASFAQVETWPIELPSQPAPPRSTQVVHGSASTPWRSVAIWNPGYGSSNPDAPAKSYATEYYSVVVDEFGFPFRTLSWTTVQGLAVGDSALSIERTWARSRGNGVGPIILPRTILPLGFTLSTLLYAGAVLAVGESLALARRRWRRAKGHCPWCGYDRAGAARGAACPECGA